MNLELVKTIGFLQTMQSALTGLPIGGSFGGADFDPSTKNTVEKRAFCWGYMTEMKDYFGPDKDVGMRDVGMDAEGIGYLHSRYKRVVNTYEPSFAGKSLVD